MYKKENLEILQGLGWEYQQHAPPDHFCKGVGNDKGWLRRPGDTGFSCYTCCEFPAFFENIADSIDAIESLNVDCAIRRSLYRDRWTYLVNLGKTSEESVVLSEALGFALLSHLRNQTK